MIKKYKIINEKIIETNDLDASVEVYISPSDEEKNYLIENYKLDEHTLGSALDPDEQSRMEFEPEHIALILKRPKNYEDHDNCLFKIASFGLFLFKNKVVVILSEDIPIFEKKYTTKILSIQDIALKIIYSTISHFVNHLKVINMMSEALESKINKSMENKYLYDLFTLEKSLVYYLNAINSNFIVIEKIKANAVKIGFNQEEIETLDDIIIENTQCYRQAEIYSNILASLMDARVSIVNNNINVLMKRLTMITIAIMLPTFVVSIFSMNVIIPLQKLDYAFWIILGFSITSVAILYFILRIKKW
jgi:magnesium transporter